MQTAIQNILLICIKTLVKYASNYQNSCFGVMKVSDVTTMHDEMWPVAMRANEILASYTVSGIGSESILFLPLMEMATRAAFGGCYIYCNMVTILCCRTE